MIFGRLWVICEQWGLRPWNVWFPYMPSLFWPALFWFSQMPSHFWFPRIPSQHPLNHAWHFILYILALIAFRDGSCQCLPKLAFYHTNQLLCLCGPRRFYSLNLQNRFFLAHHQSPHSRDWCAANTSITLSRFSRTSTKSYSPTAVFLHLESCVDIAHQSHPCQHLRKYRGLSLALVWSHGKPNF